MDLELRRYSQILRRWVWPLVATVTCATLVSWLVASENHTNPWPVALIVAFGGFVWGLIGIAGIELLIDNVKTVDEVAHITPAPVLATVETSANGSGSTPFSLFDGDQTQLAGAYFGADHSLLSLSRGRGGRSVLVCSPSSTAFAGAAGANLAAASALSGRPTLLIDADRFSADLSRSLGLGGHEGFTDALADPAGNVLLQLVPSVPNLYVLPAGRTPISTHTPITRAHLRHVVERSGARASLVVIAGPPVGSENYGLGPGLAAAVDDVVLLAVADETKRRSMKRTVATLSAIGANLTGVVFVRYADATFVRNLKSAGSNVWARAGAMGARSNGHVKTQQGQAPAQEKPVRKPATPVNPESREAQAAQANRVSQAAARAAQAAQASKATQAAQAAKPVTETHAVVETRPSEAAPAASPTQPGLWERFLAVTAGWVAVLMVRFRSPAPGGRTATTSRGAATEQAPGIKVKAQLAAASLIHSYATRREERERAQAKTRESQGAGQASRQKVLELPMTAGPSGDDQVRQWLREAEKDHRRGNTAAAKALVQRVLDREPRNEEAWHLRLMMSEVPQIAPPIEQQQQAVARSRRGMRARWLVVPVLALAVVALAGYFIWPQLSGFLSARGAPLSQTPVPPSTPRPTAAATVEAGPGRFFPETGFTVSEPFLSFWDSHSGARLFGYPISTRILMDTKEGPIQVQYFERARFELHPGANGQPAQVLLGTIGVEVPVEGAPANPLPEGLQGEPVTFQVGQSSIDVPEKFATFWQNNGGLSIFGNPITPVLIDTTSGQPLAVQYFERARFEYHPEATGGNDVQLSRLGALLHKKP
ncbi:MAG: hypothetical protein ACJ78Q_18290 [Chloroflexia bacterium]